MKTGPVSSRLVRGFAFAAGLMDFGTGSGLLVAPGFTLRAMQVSVPGPEALTFVQFVGAFVGAVGASYLLALLGRGCGRLWAVFRGTLVFRFAAGSFVAWAVVDGRLDARWLVVTATDFALVLVQLELLARQPREDD